MLSNTLHSPVAWLAFVLAGWLVLPTAEAAIIQVPPGTNTLQTFITTASNGDVLELVDGTYAGAVTVSGKNLTVRARTGTTPLLTNNIQISSVHRLVLQGLSFANDVEVSTGNTSATLVVLQSTFKNAVIKCRGLKCIVVGNYFDPQAAVSTGFDTNVIGDSNTVESVFAGNEMQRRATSRNDNNAYFYFQGGMSHIVGNKFRLDAVEPIYQNSGASLFRVESGVTTILGNRFELFLDYAYSADGVYVPSMLRIGNTAALIRNNTFTLESASGISLITTGYRISALRAVDVTPTGGEVRIHNNVFDYRNISFGASVNPAQGAIFAQRHVQALSGNIFLGIQHGAVQVAPGVLPVITDNLCYQVGSACPGTNAQTVNPLFTNSAIGNYRLLAGSPAINAGPISPLLVDIDGSRNDLGVHGGPFDLDQFDVQRVPSSVPYIYPLFEANKAIDGNGNLQIRLIGVARNQ